jgi:prepilin-type N-terminal cleavage/methylation domain-containing protein
MSYKKAFTLVELLVVITIIGLVASAALVMVKDTAEDKALSYTKKVMSAYVSHLASTDDDNYFTGFVNDFGTMAPHPCFLNTTCKDQNYSFVGNLGVNPVPKYRFNSMGKQDGTKFPAPFMSDCHKGEDQCEDNTTNDLTHINKVLYAGYQGSYWKDENGFNDGWNTPIDVRIDHNISALKDDGKNFLRLRSAGSDRVFEDGNASLVRSEFDLSQDARSIEKLYADDYNQTYDKKSFLISSLQIKICTKQTSDTNVSLLIYSPMLYYVENSSGFTCNEYNTTHADCGSNYERYIPFYGVHPDFDRSVVDQNLSWHIGLMKMQLYFDENESRLFINQGDLLNASDSNKDLAFDFNNSNEELNLSASAFFDGITVRKPDQSDIGWSFDSNPKDADNPFYMYAGTKVLSLWEHNSTSWKETQTKLIDLKPGRREKIEIGCD